ncbi:MAG: hypothetical protein PHR11_04305 [Candidatus Omnitrophica bacterium]|nr:hypothetical protein [Candidatus Omnitrophota bacterium]
MEFEHLKTSIKKVGFETARKESETYLELVLVRQHLSPLLAALDGLFGSSVWPSGNALTPEIQEVIKGFGGIMQGQTLYFWHNENSFVFAMLWPWQDGEHITVKLAKL